MRCTARCRCWASVCISSGTARLGGQSGRVDADSVQGEREGHHECGVAPSSSPTIGFCCWIRTYLIRAPSRTPPAAGNPNNARPPRAAASSGARSCGVAEEEHVRVVLDVDQHRKDAFELLGAHRHQHEIELLVRRDLAERAHVLPRPGAGLGILPGAGRTPAGPTVADRGRAGPRHARQATACSRRHCR